MGKSQTKAKNKYNAKAYDRISVTVKKGVKEEWKSEAEKQGLSLNAFIDKAVNQMMAVVDNNDTIENTLALDNDTEVSSSTEQNIQEISETDILNNALMKIAESCQKLLSAHLDLINLFPYDESNEEEEDDDNGVIKSPYRQTIKGYMLYILRQEVYRILNCINNSDMKNSVRERLNDINDDISDFKDHIATNDLEEYLEEFNEMMGITNR